VDSLTLFGLFAVAAMMMMCYALESRSHWFVLAFAGTCVLASAYGLEARMILESEITCPQCGHRATEQMPTDACQFFYR
jgi:hypothetical protein